MILLIGAACPDRMFPRNSSASLFGSNAMVVVTIALIAPLTAADFDL